MRRAQYALFEITLRIILPQKLQSDHCETSLTCLVSCLSQISIFSADTLKIAVYVNNSNHSPAPFSWRYFHKHPSEFLFILRRKIIIWMIKVFNKFEIFMLHSGNATNVNIQARGQGSHLKCNHWPMPTLMWLNVWTLTSLSPSHQNLSRDKRAPA